MNLSKLAIDGMKSSATVWTGQVKPGDLARLVESPAEALTEAGVSLPKGDLRVRLEVPTTDKAKTSDGGVIIIILDDGTVIIIVTPVTVEA